MTIPVEITKTSTLAKPFLKWAGGKVQLLSQIERYYPAELQEGKIERYIEPFLGSGAVFMHVAQHYAVNEFYLSDINPELILVYQTVRDNPESLLELLRDIQKNYQSCSPDKRSDYFYQIRDEFNNQVIGNELVQSKNGDRHAVKTRRAAYMIFLNKTCFNGLFRVNRNGKFNVPFGRYAKPLICDEENIMAVSRLLKHVEINVGEFDECVRHVNEHTFMYFDPPYRPISTTSSFTSYSKSTFSDREQSQLAKFFRDTHEKYGAKLMLSNSDPKNIDPTDNFFEELYIGFRIRRVQANRMINSDAKRRGKISELLITNY